MLTKQSKVSKNITPVIDTPAVTISNEDGITRNGEAAINISEWTDQPSVSQQILMNRDLVVPCDDISSESEDEDTASSKVGEDEVREEEHEDEEDENEEEIQRLLEKNKADEEELHKKLEAMKRKSTVTSSALQYADYITPPKKERDDIINRAYFHGHFGIKAVETTIHRDYNMHWTNMRDDIQRIISTCDACSHLNIAKVGYHPFRSVLPDQHLDHWSLDLGTFNTTSASGNNYINLDMSEATNANVFTAIEKRWILGP
ncbi:hypothetical protein BD770DRAFT_438933 [Pilaira anomala]|nr:hypothetical protein BD770DRAFT_438933 [Pilaira anomala]